MPRPRRISLEGLIYHVLNRGNNRQVVFRDNADFELFLRTLKKFKEKYLFKLYGYCLMDNHIHLILEPTLKNTLSKIMQSITLSHLRLYHKKYHSSGHLWQGRFHNPIIQKDEYLLECLRYVELNPVRAKIVERPEDYSFSSYRFHAYGEDKDELLESDPVFLSLADKEKERQAAYRKFFSLPQKEEVIKTIRRSLVTGFALATESFKEELRNRLSLQKPRLQGRPRLKR